MWCWRGKFRGFLLTWNLITPNDNTSFVSSPCCHFSELLWDMIALLKILVVALQQLHEPLLRNTSNAWWAQKSNSIIGNAYTLLWIALLSSKKWFHEKPPKVYRCRTRTLIWKILEMCHGIITADMTAAPHHGQTCVKVFIHCVATMQTKVTKVISVAEPSSK